MDIFVIYRFKEVIIMAKYPKFLQDSENSCGAYCIKMILNYYHFDDEIKNIKYMESRSILI